MFRVILLCFGNWLVTALLPVLGNHCGGRHTTVIWRAHCELHWLYQCGLQIYEEGFILWYLQLIKQVPAVFFLGHFILISYDSLYICSWQIFSLMSKVVLMFMLLLINMLKFNVLMLITNIKQSNMACRYGREMSYWVFYFAMIFEQPDEKFRWS